MHKVLIIAASFLLVVMPVSASSDKTPSQENLVLLKKYVECAIDTTPYGTIDDEKIDYFYNLFFQGSKFRTENPKLLNWIPSKFFSRPETTQRLKTGQIKTNYEAAYKDLMELDASINQAIERYNLPSSPPSPPSMILPPMTPPTAPHSTVEPAAPTPFMVAEKSMVVAADPEPLQQEAMGLPFDTPQPPCLGVCSDEHICVSLEDCLAYCFHKCLSYGSNVSFRDSVEIFRGLVAKISLVPYASDKQEILDLASFITITANDYSSFRAKALNIGFERLKKELDSIDASTPIKAKLNQLGYSDDKLSALFSIRQPKFDFESPAADEACLSVTPLGDTPAYCALLDVTAADYSVSNYSLSDSDDDCADVATTADSSACVHGASDILVADAGGEVLLSACAPNENEKDASPPAQDLVDGPAAVSSPKVEPSKEAPFKSASSVASKKLSTSKQLSSNVIVAAPVKSGSLAGRIMTGSGISLMSASVVLARKFFVRKKLRALTSAEKIRLWSAIISGGLGSILTIRGLYKTH